MTIHSTVDFNGQADGATPTLPSGWTSSGSPGGLIEADAALHGDRGLRLASTGTSGRYQHDMGANRTGLHVIDFYFRLTAIASANVTLAGFYSLTSGGALIADCRINTTRTVTIRNGTTATPANPGNPTVLSLNHWYRFALGATASADTLEARVYDGESASPMFTIVGALTSDLVRVAFFGPATAGAGGAVEYDTVRVADEWLPPVNPPAPPAESPTEWRLEGGVWRPYVRVLL